MSFVSAACRYLETRLQGLSDDDEEEDVLCPFCVCIELHWDTVCFPQEQSFSLCYALVREELEKQRVPRCFLCCALLSREGRERGTERKHFVELDSWTESLFWDVQLELSPVGLTVCMLLYCLICGFSQELCGTMAVSFNCAKV